MGMKHRLLPEEMVVADGGYRDPLCSYGTEEYDNGELSYIRAKHEAFNKRLRQFSVLKGRFRHSIRRHGDCVFAVANLTYLLIEQGEAIFE